MQFVMPEELTMIRQTARRFVQEHLRPLEARVDAEDRIEPDLMRELRYKAREVGLFAHNLPVEIGGGGLSMLGQVVIAEETGRTTMALGKALGYLPEMLRLANDEQKPWFVVPLVSGKAMWAYAITEPDAGSDMSGLKTRARRVADGWVLDGSKQFIGHVRYADFIVVLAVTDAEAPLKGRFTLFIVEKGNPGFHHLRSIRKMGWHGSDFSAFSLDGCLVPDGAVLGRVGGGFDAIMATVNNTRVQLSGIYNGMAEELLERGVAYAKERRTFGARLADHQAIQFRLADIDCELAAAKLLAYRAATAIDEGDPEARIAASRAKYYCSEMVGRAADSVLQIFGAAGFTCDFPIERMYRDARAFRIGEGSSEMQRLQIARHLIR